MLLCNSTKSTFGQMAILIGSQREFFSAVAHRLPETSFRGATVRTIPLTQGKVALVDDEDFERVAQFKWCAKPSPQKTRIKWYAIRSVRLSRNHHTTIALHRFILDPPSGLTVDHRNGNGLDCRRQNMRVATSAQNSLNRGKSCNNTSGFKGIQRSGRRWRATPRLYYRSYDLGAFDSAEEAARAYDKFAKEHHGEFAYLNFPEDND